MLNFSSCILENVSAIALSDDELAADTLVTVAGWGHSNHGMYGNDVYFLCRLCKCFFR